MNLSRLVGPTKIELQRRFERGSSCLAVVGAAARV